MKKIFTLFVGMIIALSAVAAPLQFAKKANVKKAPVELTLPTHYLGQFDHMNRTVYRSLAGTPVSGIVSAEVTLYQGAWYLECYDANDKFVAEFGFYNGYEDRIAGTYTAGGTNGVAMFIPAAGDTVEIKGDFTVAYVSEGTQYPIYHVTASNLTDSLSRTFDFDFQLELFAYDYEKYYYAVNYPEYCGYFFDCDYVIELLDAPIVPTGDTIRHEFAQTADLSDYTAGDAYGDQWFQAISQDDTYYFGVCVNADHLIGSFTTEDFDAQYTKLYLMADTSEVKLAELKSVTVSQSGDTVILITEVSGRDGVVYIFTQKVYEPTVVDEKTVELNGELDDYYYESYGTVDFIGSDATHQFTISLYVEEGFVGTYTAEDLDSYYCVYKVDGAALDVYSVENIVVAAEDGGYVLTADILSKAGILYHLTIHASYTQGIENTADGVKAVKAIRNGQLIIIKNGVEFNAQGAVLK